MRRLILASLVFVGCGAAPTPATGTGAVELPGRRFSSRCELFTVDQRHGLPPSIELLGPDGDDNWTCRLVIARGVTVEAEGIRAEIGVRVLVGVVNGKG